MIRVRVEPELKSQAEEGHSAMDEQFAALVLGDLACTQSVLPDSAS